MRLRWGWGVVAAALAAGGCGGAGDGGLALTAQPVQKTTLSWAGDALVLPCEGTEGIAQIAGTITSEGSGADVTLTASVDGGEAVQVGVVTGDQFNGGKVKTADFSVDVEVPAGEHTITLCASQDGGRFFCADLPVDVVCVDPAFLDDEEEDCTEVAFFGNIVSNPNICRKPGAAVPVHVRGELGYEASIQIQGPGGFTASGLLRRAGESCNYHFVFARTEDCSAEPYVFTVEGPEGLNVFSTPVLPPGE